MNAITASLKLVTLTCSSWRATRLHKPETQRVNESNHTDAAKVSVKICCHPTLTKIRTLHAETYAKHVKMTRPSIQDGIRVIPNARELEHMEMIRVAREQHDDLVAEFLADYDNERVSAAVRLNGLYDPTMWPESHEIAGKFGLSARYLTCPSDPAWSEWLEETTLAATSDLADSIEHAIEHIAERCESDGKLHESVFTNLQNLLREVPHYDNGLDSRLTELAIAAQSLSLSVSDVRSDPILRSGAAKTAHSILDRFNVTPTPTLKTSSGVNMPTPAWLENTNGIA